MTRPEILALSARPTPFALAAIGAIVLTLSVVGAHHDTIRPGEQRVFRAINRLPDFLYWVLWLPMQFGNLIVGMLAGLAVALILGEWELAVVVVLATLSKLVVERVIRHRTASFAAVRQRPGTSEPGAVLRGDDVPKSGASFPSGHVILAAAIAAVLSSALSVDWSWIGWLAAALVMFGRVYVGAHNPLDVTAGLGAGMLIGGVLDLLLR